MKERIIVGDMVRMVNPASGFYGMVGKVVRLSVMGGAYISFNGCHVPVYVTFGYVRVNG